VSTKTLFLTINKSTRVAAFAVASIILAACGDSSSSVTPTVSSTSGYVADSAVTGAACQVFAITDGVAGTTPLGSGTSSAGSVDFGVVDLTGPAFIQCTGGTFTDEATGQTMDAPTLSSVVSFSPGGTYVISIFTNIAWMLANAQGDLGTALTTHNTAVADSFGLDGIDITTQVPTDLNTADADDDAAGHYGTALLMLSQVTHDGALGVNRNEVMAAVAADMADGKMAASSLAALDQAMVNFAAGDAAAKGHTNAAVNTAVLQSTGAGERPVASAGPDQSAVAAGATVTLSGSGTDADGTIASYAWTQTSGPSVTLANQDQATATFTAPSASTASSLVFTLTITDSSGNVDADTVAIAVSAQPTVTPPANIAPTASAGIDQSVAAGASVTLAGSGTDQDGSIASYKWEEVSSSGVTLSGASTKTATFTAPSLTTASSLEFKLTVTDDKGATSADNVKVSVAAMAVVTKIDQATFSAGAAVARVFGNAPFTQAASGGSGSGAVTYVSSATGVATVTSAGLVTIVGAGSATITATKAADANYNAATDSYALTVAKANQTALNAGADATKNLSDGSFTQAATGGSGTGAITYTSSDTSVATVASGGVVTLKAGGSTTITATRAGGSNYNDVSDSYDLTVIAISISGIAPTAGSTISQDNPTALPDNASSVLGSAVSGKTLTITGTGFGTTKSTVKFKSDTAGGSDVDVSGTPITTWTDTSIVLLAPSVTLVGAGAQENYTVTVTTSGGTTATSAFKYDDCDTCRLNDGCPF
jgi:hypothetical protein